MLMPGEPGGVHCTHGHQLLQSQAATMSSIERPCMCSLLELLQGVIQPLWTAQLTQHTHACWCALPYRIHSSGTLQRACPMPDTLAPTPTPTPTPYLCGCMRSAGAAGQRGGPHSVGHVHSIRSGRPDGKGGNNGAGGCGCGGGGGGGGQLALGQLPHRDGHRGCGVQALHACLALRCKASWCQRGDWGFGGVGRV